jgi:hypothetical protein
MPLRTRERDSRSKRGRLDCGDPASRAGPLLLPSSQFGIVCARPASDRHSQCQFLQHCIQTSCEISVHTRNVAFGPFVASSLTRADLFPICIFQQIQLQGPMHSALGLLMLGTGILRSTVRLSYFYDFWHRKRTSLDDPFLEVHRTLFSWTSSWLLGSRRDLVGLTTGASSSPLTSKSQLKCHSTNSAHITPTLTSVARICLRLLAFGPAVITERNNSVCKVLMVGAMPWLFPLSKPPVKAWWVWRAGVSCKGLGAPPSSFFEP